MGARHVTVAVSNPADPQRRWERLFPVDSAAIDCMAPAMHVHAIGTLPRNKRTYELAQGTEIITDIRVAMVELMGKVVGATIAFGHDDTMPILARTAFESLGFQFDEGQKLKRTSVVRLKFRAGDTNWILELQNAHGT